MSRSYRKPFTTHGSCYSAKKDKRKANKAVRRACRQTLINIINFDAFDEFMLPHRYECSHNNVWGWDRDGKQYFVSEFNKDPHLEQLIVEVDILTQVERRLDGLPAINTSTPVFNHEEWYRSIQRK